MGVDCRPDRGKWGFRICRRGKHFRRYRWTTKEEAQAAFDEFKRVLKAPGDDFLAPLLQLIGPADLKGRFADFISPCVYAVTRWSEILYIGMSANGLLRPLAHQHHLSNAFMPTDLVLVWRCGSIRKATVLEKDLIGRFKPKYNVVGIPGKRTFYKAAGGKFAGSSKGKVEAVKTNSP